MTLTPFTRKMLAIRRDQRDRERDGWLYVGENGGPLWMLHRGGLMGRRIVNVAIAACGRALWVKLDEEKDT